MEKRKNIKHGLWCTRLYSIHSGMKSRCYNKNDPSYYLYGGKGVKICDEWLGEYGVLNFYNWSVENGYDDKLSIDRIDSDGDYSPDNCRWVNRIIQNNNTKRNHRITWNGETHTVAEWARILPINVSYGTLISRIQKGWSVERAFTEPNHGTENPGHLITINGETHNKQDWCAKTGISVSAFERRVNEGMSVEEALLMPNRRKRKIKDEMRELLKFCILDNDTGKQLRNETSNFVLKPNGALYDMKNEKYVKKEGKYTIMFNDGRFLEW